MKVLVFLSLVLLATAFKRVQYEFGVENSIHWAPTPYHALHKESGYSVYQLNFCSYLPPHTLECQEVFWFQLNSRKFLQILQR